MKSPTDIVEVTHTTKFMQNCNSLSAVIVHLSKPHVSTINFSNSIRKQFEKRFISYMIAYNHVIWDVALAKLTIALRT